MFRTFLTFVVLAGLASQAAGATRSSLRADFRSQVIQNERADLDGLSRFEGSAMIQRFVRLQLLEQVPLKTRNYYIHRIPAEYRYLRPWAKLFLDRLSSQFRSRFGQPLRITGLTRSAEYQQSLRRRNRNAAAVRGPKRSVHLTGACLDISKKGMTGSQISWMRRVLVSIKQKGFLFAVEEFKQPNFHIMVYRNYPEYVARLQAGTRR